MASSKSSRLARLSAARAVNDVLAGRIPLDQALPSQRGYDEMDPRDRAFAHLIAATTFRRLGQIDAILAEYITREPHIMATNILRTAIAQLLYLGTPAHAVVGETVTLIKRSRDRKVERAAGMANAVLRRVSERYDELSAQAPSAVNFPDWLSERWINAYGPKAVDAMAQVYAASPPLDLTVKSNAQGWAERLGGTVLPGGTVRLDKIGDVTSLDGFDEGQWWVQDVAAALPVRLLGDLTGKTALDLCAAPGGKTLQLAHQGAQVTALDKSPARLKRVEENLARTGLSAKVLAGDAAKFKTAKENSFDIVLLDAPCTATGTFRRNPEVLHIKRKKMMRDLEDIQSNLLDAAAAHVAPGGILLYGVCALQREEGENQVKAFLDRSSEFSLNSILMPTDLHPVMGEQPRGFVRSLPHMMNNQGGMDGFFSAQLRKNV